MKIRTIEERDIPAVAEFERDIAVVSFRESAMTDLSFHQKKLGKALDRESEGMLVLEEDGQIAGWLWMTVQTNSVSNEKYINFKSFYMNPHPKEADLTGALMQAGMDFAARKGVDKIVGKVFAGNLPMRMVYKRFGFKPAHITMEYDAKDHTHD
jgi:L-amino acid N-acyltransferase YncA